MSTDETSQPQTSSTAEAPAAPAPTSTSGKTRKSRTIIPDYTADDDTPSWAIKRNREKPSVQGGLWAGHETGSESVLKKSREMFEQRIHNHEIDRLINPFSEFWGENKDDYMDKLENAKAVWKGADKRTKLTKADDMYGRPVDGSLTAYRGNKAKNFITNNIVEVCETIANIGQQCEDGTYECTFGALFKAYERINDKVVGMLVRARRHGLLEFPGEMLYQRQDDHVIIKLYKIPKFDELNLKYIDFKEGSEAKEEPTVQ